MKRYPILFVAFLLSYNGGRIVHPKNHIQMDNQVPQLYIFFLYLRSSIVTDLFSDLPTLIAYHGPEISLMDRSDLLKKHNDNLPLLRRLFCEDYLLKHSLSIYQWLVSEYNQVYSQHSG